jgi:hypothetical protein
MTARTPDPDIERQLAELSHASRDTLKQRWRDCYGRAPPVQFPQHLLRLGIAYRIQEEALGGLKPSLKRQLLQMANPVSRKRTANPLALGSVLIREWRGVRHTVTVTDKGMLYQSHTYRSLTEVARRITGTHQSGPIFFGLRSPRSQRA